MSKPRIEWSAQEGYHTFRRHGSFEVFWNAGNLENETEGNYDPIGWYWWACLPGYLPDSEPYGPFNSSTAAWRDARDY